MKTVAENLGIALIGVFAPIEAALAAVLVLVLLDLVSGVWAAHKSGVPVTSQGMKRSIGKVLVYELALATAFLVHQYLTGDLIPADKLVASLIGVVELKSILENFDKISGQDLFKTLIDRLSQRNKDPE